MSPTKPCVILSGTLTSTCSSLMQQPRIKVVSLQEAVQSKLTSPAANMKILSLLTLVAFPATNGQFFGIETNYNNTCMWQKEGLNRNGPREFDCPRFVIESTDQIWNMYRGKYRLKLHKFYILKTYFQILS